MAEGSPRQRVDRTGVDVLIVALASTGGWIAAAESLRNSLRRAGARVELVSTGPVPRVRTFALTDLTQAWLARRAAQLGIERHRPRAVIYFSITASLLWPARGAISLDSIAAENRPGRHGFWQRPVERRRLRQAPLLLVWSARALDPAPADHAPAVVVPPALELRRDDGPRASDEVSIGDIDGAAVRDIDSVAPRDIDALTYAGDPVKRRLELILQVWQTARRDGETLVVAGFDDCPEAPGVRSVGRVDRDQFRGLLRRSRAFVAAPRREDFGVAALEALAEGCRLVSTPSPGPYPALDLARALDPRLVDGDLGRALRVALDDPVPGYAARALELLEPFSIQAVDATVAGDVLPRLVPGWSAQR